MKKPTKTFGHLLLKWHTNIDRQMPWKDTTNPYHIWISEIILQQTQVVQGKKYFQKFLEIFPSIQTLAAASEDEVLSVWKGLGYYSRARNLHTAAKTIMTHHNGDFPDSYSEILALKGIGPYSAAAISSFAFYLPYAVLDGNVFRVLSRIFGIYTPTDTTQGKKLFSKLSQDLLGNHPPADYNQAIMDFGALICTPASPKCNICPFERKCHAFSEGVIGDLPRKSKKVKTKKRFFHYFIITDQKKILLHRRAKGDIWTGLYEPIMLESDSNISKKKLSTKVSLLLNSNISNSQINKTITKSQKLTHQIIQASFYHLEMHIDSSKYIWKPLHELSTVAMPKVVNDYLHNYLQEGTQTSLF